MAVWVVDCRRVPSVTSEPLRARRYELLHLVRTHLGAEDEAYRCIYQQEDADGVVGIDLNKAGPPCPACFHSVAAREFASGPC
jgi:hypothetical protein